MDIASIINDDTQVLEIYVCPTKACLDGDDPIRVGWDHISAIQTLGQGHTTSMRVYFHRDMCYTYDKENDGQRVIARRLCNEALLSDNLYVMSLEEDVLPSHRFPTTDEIAYETDLTRTTYRINNRINVVHDKEGVHQYMYLRYTHAPNVDTKKTVEDLEKAIRRAMRATRPNASKESTSGR